MKRTEMNRMGMVPARATRVQQIRLVSAIVLLLLAAGSLSGCRYYSFTGATIQEHLSTISIPLVDDASLSTVTGLEDELTELFVDRFVRQTRLVLRQDEFEADSVLRGRITRYQNMPTSVSGDERATRNRVTITVQVTWQDLVENQALVERTFSSFEDYDPANPSSEEDAARAALVKIADDVFTAATSNW